jgi:hypothetical protein
MSGDPLWIRQLDERTAREAEAWFRSLAEMCGGQARERRRLELTYAARRRRREARERIWHEVELRRREPMTLDAAIDATAHALQMMPDQVRAAHASLNGRNTRRQRAMRDAEILKAAKRGLDNRAIVALLDRRGYGTLNPKTVERIVVRALKKDRPILVSAARAIAQDVACLADDRSSAA